LDGLNEVRAENRMLLEEAKNYNDPDELSRILQEKTKFRDDANRWTENLWQIESWAKKKLPNVNMREIEQQHEIPEDIDTFP
jgi:hypothetical protein